MSFTVEELRPLAILEDLPREALAWLADHGTRIELDIGQRMFERGQPSDFMFIVVQGVIQRYEEIAGQWLVVATTRPGQVTGMLPFSRMTHYPGHTVAAEPSVVLRVNVRDFDEMLRVSHALGQRLVAEMSNRVRGDVRLEQQREKLMALGRLSAGLAHELNNPAAAIQRTVGNLSERLGGQQGHLMALARAGLDGSAFDAIEQLWTAARDPAPSDPTPLERSEREEAMVAWLEDHKVADSWEIAGAFAGTGLQLPDLERFADAVPGTMLREALAWVACRIEIDLMVAEIGASAERVSSLVSSVKTYSHMDRSSEHRPTDVREGLDNTLTMFRHRLEQNHIRVARDYPDDLPLIPGNPGELNQVWTNLIDNAIDAMADGGELRIAIDRDEWCVSVQVIDEGSGIPESIRHRIFDPFFTTKEVGEGMGLGLDIARRIVDTHRGQIEVRSRPGRTAMQVRLPIAPDGIPR